MMNCRASSHCLNCMGWQDMSLTEGWASSPCLDCVGWQDMSFAEMMEGRASSPCLNCVGWQDMCLTEMMEGQASSPCLNCMGWQDMSLTVVRKIERPPLILTVLGGRTRAHLDNSSQASSPYHNCVGWQDKPTVNGAWCCTFWLSQSAHHHNLASLPFWCWPSNIAYEASHIILSSWNICIPNSHLSDAVKLASYSYCSVMVVWSIESRKTTKWS